MKNAAMIFELIGTQIRERNQMREAAIAAKRDLATVQLERDELRVKLRRLEAEPAAKNCAKPENFVNDTESEISGPTRKNVIRIHGA